jgi:hypothetical protein
VTGNAYPKISLMLFADEPASASALTWITCIMAAIAMIGTGIERLLGFLRDREKIRADNALAIKTAEIAAASAALAEKVKLNTLQMQACEVAHQRTSDELASVKADLAACTEKHNSTESRISSLEQSVVAVATAVTPPGK